MPKFSKKPIVIDEVQYTGDNNPFGAVKTDESGKPYIQTMHDGQIVVLEVGDWVSRIPIIRAKTTYLKEHTILIRQNKL